MLPSNDGRTCLIFLDDVVRFCLPFIFAGLGYESFEAYAVKFTRDAEMELRGDAGEGLVEKVARGVKSRKRGEPVRFVYDRRMPDEMLRYFKRRFGIDRYDICVGGSRYHNMKDLMRFPDVGRGDLRFEPWPPAPVPTSTRPTVRSTGCGVATCCSTIPIRASRTICVCCARRP